MCSATSSVVALLTVLCAPFQFSNRAAGEAAEFSRSGVELLGVIGTARLECGEPAAEAGELIRRQLGNSFGDFFDFHAAQYSTTKAWLSDGKGLGARPPTVLGQVSSAPNQVIAAPDPGSGQRARLMALACGIDLPISGIEPLLGPAFFFA